MTVEIHQVQLSDLGGISRTKTEGTVWKDRLSISLCWRSSVAFDSFSVFSYLDTMSSYSAVSLRCPPSRNALSSSAVIKSDAGTVWDYAHLHGHLISPETQGFSSTLHDDGRTHSAEDVRLPVFGRVEEVLEDIVLVWQLRFAGWAYALVAVFAGEPGSGCTVIAVYVAVAAGK